MRHTYADLTGTTFWNAPAKGHWIELGSLRLPREEIVGCRIEDVVERDTAGKLATLGLFFAAALVLLLGVVEFGWRTRFLIGAVVLGTIAAVSGMEALGINRIVYYRLDVLLKDGRRVGYTTASRADAEALAVELSR